jgi:hypothetical protein
MRGGARPNAGRPAGIPNRVKRQAELMRVAKPGRGKPGVEYLQKYLRRFDALADAAWKANEPALFTKYSKIVIECSTVLSNFQTPKLSAVATVPVNTENRLTKFVVSIFEPRQSRQSVNLPAPDAAASEVVDAVAQPAAPEPPQPEPPPPKPQPSAPPSPSPNANGDLAPLMSCNQPRSVYEHLFFSTWRAPLIRGGMTRGGRG